MKLDSLVLENFRCYDHSEIAFSPGLNVVLGPNATGKTTILEAIYLLATTTSPRGGSARAMIRHGESWARVSGRFTVRERPVTLRVTIGERNGGRSGTKALEVDGREVASARDVIGRVQAVLFWVGELEVVKGAPAARRAFLNAAIGQTSPRYLDDLIRYRRALRQRNEVLKSAGRMGVDGRVLAPWTQALIESGVPLTMDRAEYVDALAQEASVLHQRLGVGAEGLGVRYAPSVPAGETEDEVEEAFVRRLEETHVREVERGSTQIGPHRDDIVLEVDGIDLRRFGSQGQQRTAALALTLAQAAVARRRTEAQPILLLDDCLSELDVSRGAAMLDLSDDHEQMIVTSACCPEHLEARLANAHLISTGGEKISCAPCEGEV